MGIENIYVVPQRMIRVYVALNLLEPLCCVFNRGLEPLDLRGDFFGLQHTLGADIGGKVLDYHDLPDAHATRNTDTLHQPVDTVVVELRLVGRFVLVSFLRILHLE